MRVYWQVDNGAVHWGPTSEYQGGQRRYGDPGVYYHHLRGQVSGTRPGDTVKVWFQAGQKHASDPFTYTAKAESSNKVLLMVAEDYTGPSPDQTPGPHYQDTYAKALQDAHLQSYDVYDVDAQGRAAPSTLGVLSHYKAVIWETGDDLHPPPGPGRRHGRGEDARRRDHRRARLHERRRQALGRRQDRPAGRLGPVPLQPAAGPTGAGVRVEPDGGPGSDGGRSTRPELQLCDDVQRLPAVLARRVRARQPGRRPRPPWAR